MKFRAREFREREGLSLEEAAARAGMSYSTLSRIERNQGGIFLHHLVSLAHLYGCKVEDLLSDREPLTADELALLANYRALDEKARSAFVELLKTLPRERVTPPHDVPDSAPQTAPRVPLKKRAAS